jgi:beta-lactamase regulating signal transducer with metallopeptidase domain
MTMEMLNRLLEISIYSVILFLAIIGIKRVFKNKMSPALHFMVWFLLIARLCVPFTIDSGLRLIIIPETPSQTTAQTQGAAADSQDDPVSYTAEPQSNTNVQNIPQAQQVTINDTTTQIPSSQASGLFQQIASMKWTDILIAVWLIGMLFVGAWMIYIVMRMNRIIFRLGIKPKANTRELLEKCKAELGIKKDIPLYLLPKISTPALTIGFKPKLVLPFDIAETLSGQQLEFAIKHELTHYKRKDNITSLLLRILEVVYWFNPVVWLMGKCILSDMETACDSMVVKTLGKQDKKQYVLTLLDMFSQKRTPQFMLGMALNNTEKVAEKRIRGVYMKNKSKRSVKLIAGILAAVMIVACFTTACQPTPEEDVVVNKGDGKLEDAIASSDASTQEYEAPSHWMDSTEIADLSVSIDADVNVPDIDQFPVGVLTADEITQDQADKIMEVLLQGATLYEQGPDLDEAVTKEQIMERIVEIQQDISDPNSDFNTKCEKGTPEYEEGLASRQAQIESLQEQYATAPDTMPEVQPASTKFEQDMDSTILAPLAIPEDATDEEREQIEAENKEKQEHPEKYLPYEITGVATLNNGQHAYLNITKNSTYFGVGAELELWPERYDVPVVPCEKTLEQAEGLALDTVRALGLDYLNIAAVNTGYTIERDSETQKATAIHECHVFYLARQLNGVVSNYALYIEPKDYQYAVWEAYEYVQIVINEQGVACFTWNNPTKLLSMENENVTLKPFSEIQEIFKKQITIKGAWNTTTAQDENVISRRIVIEEARLGLMRTVRQDRPGEYLLLPVWDFYGYEVNKCEEQIYQGPELDENNEYTVRDFGRSYLTINAIDGSVIDRGLGY